MSLSIFEREEIIQYFKKGQIQKEQIQQYLDDDIYTFLKNKNYINTISDKILFSNRSKSRPYEQVTITKFLTPDFDYREAISTVAGAVTGSFLFFLDFHFLFLGKPDEGGEEFIKFQTAAKATAMNDTFKITNSGDYEKLSQEFKNKNYSDILNECATNHISLYEYEESGLRPLQLLSMIIHVQKFPDV